LNPQNWPPSEIVHNFSALRNFLCKACGTEEDVSILTPILRKSKKSVATSSTPFQLRQVSEPVSQFQQIEIIQEENVPSISTSPCSQSPFELTEESFFQKEASVPVNETENFENLVFNFQDQLLGSERLELPISDEEAEIIRMEKLGLPSSEEEELSFDSSPNESDKEFIDNESPSLIPEGSDEEIFTDEEKQENVVLPKKRPGRRSKLTTKKKKKTSPK
jgi:hypothetical protein